MSPGRFHSPPTGVGLIWPKIQTRPSLRDLMAKLQLILSVDISPWIITTGGKAQPITLLRVMRGNRSCGVKFLSYPCSGRRERAREKRNLCETVLFFPLSEGQGRKRVGKSYLEGVLKEIHVGINPDIIKSTQQPSPLLPHVSVCTHCN